MKNCVNTFFIKTEVKLFLICIKYYIYSTDYYKIIIKIRHCYVFNITYRYI